jgi:hypothetical protein
MEDYTMKPSAYFDAALKKLKLDGTIPEAKVKQLKDMADVFQGIKKPGHPNITMAAYLNMMLPFISETNVLINRSTVEIAKAFHCDVQPIKHRMTRIKTEWMRH